MAKKAKANEENTDVSEPVSQKKPVSGEYLMRTAELLGVFSEKFHRLAEYMQQNQTPPIVVRGTEGVHEFLTRLDNYYSNCSNELGFLKIGEPRLVHKSNPNEAELPQPSKTQ